jgi:hypothetical protein
VNTFGERHRVRREYDPIPEDDGFIHNATGGAPADYD